MIQLYIVRHGETKENAEGILQGHLQGHLSEKGIQQAIDMRNTIAKEIRPDRIFSSDLKRTVDTATILNEPFQLPLELSPLLRERDWGEYTGKKISSISKGEFPPSVESIANMMKRAGDFLQQLAKECKEQPQVRTILIVSHGVFSRCLQAAATHKGIHDIPIMKNLEMRNVQLSVDFIAQNPYEDTMPLYDNGSILSHGKES